jgi:hypothetical protein
LQRWSFHLIPKKATINALVSIVLDPATKDSDFPLILYHKVCRVIIEHCTIADETDRLNQDQANEKDYSHEGFGFSFKKTQADIVVKFMSSKEVKYFKVRKAEHSHWSWIVKPGFGLPRATAQTRDRD